MSNAKPKVKAGLHLDNESAALDLYRLLQALDRWNSHHDEEGREPEPEATAAYRCDAQTCGLIARQLELYPPFVWECFANVPVKRAKEITGWLVTKADLDPNFDMLGSLQGWRRKPEQIDLYGPPPDEESYREAREELNERMRAMAG